MVAFVRLEVLPGICANVLVVTVAATSRSDSVATAALGPAGSFAAATASICRGKSVSERRWGATRSGILPGAKGRMCSERLGVVESGCGGITWEI